MGYYDGLDCCSHLDLMGNGFCDDDNNNVLCNFDYGDCNTNCLHNNIGDSYCNDENNFSDCGNYDGGDCCGGDVNTLHCTVCECLEP